MKYSHEVLDTYLSLDARCIRTLNNLYLVWNAYAIVILVKLHWLFQTSNSTFGTDFVPALKTTHYLDAIQAKLTEVATDGQSPSSEAFGFVFMKLKMWHCKCSPIITMHFS
jgi:hypothetical protein